MSVNTGSCLCGDITWEINGELDMLINCHCSICRKIHGSDYVTFAGIDAGVFRWTSGEEKVVHYASTPTLPAMRPFCPRCGSKVASLLPDGSQAFMPAGNLEGDIKRPLDFHMFVGSKAPWFEITDEAPTFDAFPDAFQGEEQHRAERPAKTAGATGGSCHCDRIRYEFDMPFERMGYCHCSLCRKSTSSAMSSEVFVEREDFRWLRGQDALTRFDLPDSHFSVHFCSDCGSLMPIALDDEEDLILVPAGSLNQDPHIRPMAHIFTGSKANWDSITDELPQFEEWPPED